MGAVLWVGGIGLCLLLAAFFAREEEGCFRVAFFVLGLAMLGMAGLGILVHLRMV